MNELEIGTYREMISKDTQTMKSTDLHKFVYDATGKYKDAKDFQKKIKVVLFDTETPTDAQISDGADFAPSFDNRGYVQYFNLSEVECNMIMASIDVRHLRLISEVFVAVKHTIEDDSIKLVDKQIEEIDMRIMSQRIEQVKLLQSLGVNFDPTSLVDTGKIKSKLTEDVGNAVTDVVSDIRPAVNGYSTTAMLKEFRVLMQTKHFNEILVELGVLSTTDDGFKELSDDYRWYGYNRHSSSINKYPVLVSWYKDRFTDLLTMIRNDGYID